MVYGIQQTFEVSCGKVEFRRANFHVNSFHFCFDPDKQFVGDTHFIFQICNEKHHQFHTNFISISCQALALSIYLDPAAVFVPVAYFFDTF